MNADILSLIGSFSSQQVAARTKRPGDTAPTSEVLPSQPPAYAGSALSVIVFSKDRPFQLHALLKSIDDFFLDVPAHVFVIYTTSQEWAHYYTAVFRHASASITPILETDFSKDVENCCSRIFGDPENRYIMFCVDDLLFYDAVSFREITRSLESCPQLYGVHLKLHPGISFSHAASCPSPPPRLLPLDSALRDGVLGFSFRSATADWAYPFDLCGCVYRSGDVKRILDLLVPVCGEQGCSGPNVLEVSGNRVLASEAFSHLTLGGCLRRPVCAVLTVNRVQSAFDVPVYSSEGGDLCSLNAHLLPLLKGGGRGGGGGGAAVTMDYARYRASSRQSVHVEDLFMLPLASASGVAYPSPEAKVSVVIPVWNGAPFISRCLTSLLTQTYTQFEVVCVLNGCTDDSEIECLSFVDQFAQRSVSLVVLVLPEQGLVGALQAGLAKAAEAGGSEYVCRLDADDEVVSARRLADQVSFLEAHPRIHVLGAQSLLAGDPSLLLAQEGKQQLSLSPVCLAASIPTHPVLVQWEMMFRCVVLHPTVMFRRDVVQACGGYGNHLGLATACAEDYVLWARVLQRHPLSIASLPHVHMCLLQHAGSKSAREADIMRGERSRVQWSLASPLLRSSSCEAGAAVLWDDDEAFSIFAKINCPEEVSSAAEIRAVCRMIHELHEAFLASFPPDSLNHSVVCLLRESRTKIASSFLSKCVFKFAAVELLEVELALLDVSAPMLLKYQVAGLVFS